MLAAIGTLAEVFESLMLLCFGTSWPFAILKTWRTKRSEGKSLIFLVLVFIGYLSGIAAKAIAYGVWNMPAVTALYGLNAALVAFDLVLVVHYRRHPPSLPIGQA
jgi:hypothetical protein